MNVQGIDQLLTQLQAASGNAAAPQAGAPDFAALLGQSIADVNRQQVGADALSKQYEAGAPNASLQNVMVELQKANLSFQTMVQVRNKLVTAYQDIMNMQV